MVWFITVVALFVLFFWGVKKLSNFQRRIKSVNLLTQETRDSFLYTSSRDQLVDKVSHSISYIVYSLSSLAMETNPYPPHIRKKLEELESIHKSILPYAGTDVANKAIEDAQVSLFSSDLNEPEETTITRATFLCYISDTGRFDFTAIKMALFNKFFLNYRPYWERQISELKKTSAIIHRREYLINSIEEFKSFLEEQNIEKFHKLLNDYRDYNVAELRRIKDASIRK